MPKYTLAAAQAAKYQLEPQVLTDDGKWSPLPLCTEVDTDAGTAAVLRQQMVPDAIAGKFRVVHTETGEVNPAPAAAVEANTAATEGNTAAVADVVAALEVPPVVEAAPTAGEPAPAEAEKA